METIIDYVMRLEEEKEMDALDLWTKKNIRNYLGDPDAKNDKRYPPSMQKVRKLIREVISQEFSPNKLKPKFSKLRLDFKGVYYMPRIIKSSRIGDAAILKEIIEILKREKIITISSLFFNPELTLKKGIYTKIKPNKVDNADINKAILILNKLNKYNFSQGTVVRNNKLIAIEGRGGTQNLLKRSKNKKFKNNGVLVKFPKKKQDLRVDLPTIGFKTLKQCKLAGLKGIVVKNKQNIFLERKKCINFANKNKMFILSK